MMVLRAEQALGAPRLLSGNAERLLGTWRCEGLRPLGIRCARGLESCKPRFASEPVCSTHAVP